MFASRRSRRDPNPAAHDATSTVGKKRAHKGRRTALLTFAAVAIGLCATGQTLYPKLMISQLASLEDLQAIVPVQVQVLRNGETRKSVTDPSRKEMDVADMPRTYRDALVGGE